MKILQIITLFSVGGATETVISLASGLKKRDLEVDIITGPQVEFEGDMFDDAKKFNLNVINISRLKREISIYDDLVAFFKIYKIIKRGNYSVIHTHSSKAGILGRWAAKFAGAKNIIHTVHGWSFNDFQHPVTKLIIILIERITARITTRLICVTELDIQKGISNKIGNAAQYLIIRSGIDLTQFYEFVSGNNNILEELSIKTDEIVIGTITRFSSQKAPLDTVLAFKEIINKGYQNVRLIMVGDGPLLSEAISLAKKFSLFDQILFLGIRRDIPRLLKAMDIFVLSSLWEGLPRVIPQAMAAGVSVVATNIDGNAEIVKDGITGLLVEPKNPLQIANAVVKLIENRELVQKLVNNAKNDVIEFDEKKMVEDTYILYSQITE